MRQRRTFSREYKIAAVKKVVEQGLSYAQVTRDLGIRDNLLHNWQKALEADGTISKAIEESPRIDAELKRLREENRQLKIERDILKKRRPSLQKKALEMPIHL
jgi:transposase